MKSRHTSLLSIAMFSSFVFVGLLAPLASAGNFPEGKEDLFIQNNILFYEPGVDTNDPYFYYGCGGSFTSDGSVDGNKNYRGDTIWSDAELSRVQKNMSAYKSAANSHGLPWEVMAVIHYLEHSLSNTNPSNGQGIFQLYDYTKGGKVNRFEPTSTDVSDTEFLRQANLAADELQGKAKGLDLTTADGIKKLFFKYNGTAKEYRDKAISMGFTGEQSWNGEGSPYVMNRFDAARDPAHLETMSPLWRGRYVGDGDYDPNSVSTRFGAYIRFLALVNIFGGGTTTYTTTATQSTETATYTSNSIIAKKAIEIGKPGFNKGDQTPTQAYVIAMNHAGTYDTEYKGASCDIFVSTVIQNTVDKNYPKTNGENETQREYLKSHPELYQKIEVNGDINKLQEGDIMIAGAKGKENHRHTQIFIKLNGKPSIASAAKLSRTAQYYTPEAFSLSISYENGAKVYPFDVYRYIGNTIGGTNTSASSNPCTPVTTTPSAPTTTPSAPSQPTEPESPYPTDNPKITEPKNWYTESDFYSNSDGIGCPQGTLDNGTYNNAHYDQKLIAVRLCEVPSIVYDGRKYTGREQQNGHAIASSLAAEAFYRFAQDYKAYTDKEIVVSQSFRTKEFQADVYSCVHGTMSNSDFMKKYGITDSYNCQSSFKSPAQATKSKHEAGLAMDLDMGHTFGDGETWEKRNIKNEKYYGYDPNSCTTGAFTSSTKTDTGSTWNGHSRWTLKDMAILCEMLPKYGLKMTVHNEPWHIQYVGKYN